MKKIHIVYNNVYTMLSKYREFKVETPLLSLENFSNEIKYNEYIVIRASADATNIRGAINNYTVLIAPNSDYASKSGDFKNMLGKILNGKKGDVVKSEDNIPINICFISETPFTSHIYKKITEKQEEQFFYSEDHTYDIFRFEIFKQNMVPAHRIVNIDDVFNNYYFNEHNLGVISHKDAAAVWIGAKPNMIVELEYISENAVYAYTYKLCKKAKGNDVDNIKKEVAK
jgi:DNA-directed RNA polymerase subunit H (RpoH/RPB5)